MSTKVTINLIEYTNKAYVLLNASFIMYFKTKWEKNDELAYIHQKGNNFFPTNHKNKAVGIVLNKSWSCIIHILVSTCIN